MKFTVYANASEFGVIEAANEQEARDKAAQMAGYKSEADMVEQIGQTSEIVAEPQYAIRVGDRYYTGKAGEEWLSDDIADAFCYTEEGAIAKAYRFAFWNATVEQVR